MPGRVRRIKAPEPEPENDYEAQIAEKRAKVKALMANMKGDLAAAAPPLPVAASRKRKAKTEIKVPTRKSTRLAAVASAPRSREEFEDEEFEDDEDSSPKKGAGGKRKVPSAHHESSDSEEEDVPLHRQPKINGKVFGPIWGVKVGDWWEKRDECGRRGVHPPTVAGIYGGGDSGAYSVAVSAGYPEDRDNGDSFTYTGSGGRELKKKNLRTAPQSSDQRLERGNLALFVSAQTKKPIRVIRGYKAELGPLTGYRYDGLYKVERAYEAMNAEGKYKVWKFDFVRLPGQAPVDYEGKRRAQLEDQDTEEISE